MQRKDQINKLDWAAREEQSMRSDPTIKLQVSIKYDSSDFFTHHRQPANVAGTS